MDNGTLRILARSRNLITVSHAVVGYLEHHLHQLFPGIRELYGKALCILLDLRLLQIRRYGIKGDIPELHL